jgi:hypothetical protein
MGDAFVGIISPSKIYNILAVGLPVLYIGPAQSHVTELFCTLDPIPRFYPAENSDVSMVVQQVLKAKDQGFSYPSIRYDAMLCRDKLLPRMMAIITGERFEPTETEKAASVPGN